MEQLLPQLMVLLAGCPRVFGAIALMPGLSATFVPPMVRAILAAAVALAMAPLIVQGSAEILSLTPQAYLALLVSELVLGGIAGYLLSCLLEAARLAGEMVDLQIGFRAGSMYDPVSGGSSSLLGQLWYLAAVVFFFTLDGHHWLLAGLARSYELCPVGELLYQPKLAELALHVMTALFALSLRMAAPVVAALILADLSLGLIGRSMPQMNLMLVGMPGKILVGLAALAMSSPATVHALTAMLERFKDALQVLLRVTCGA